MLFSAQQDAPSSVQYKVFPAIASAGRLRVYFRYNLIIQFSSVFAVEQADSIQRFPAMIFEL